LEYSFRTSKRSEITTVSLDDYRLILRKGSTEEIIPYASIVTVRVSRTKDFFCTYIYPDARKVVLVKSKSFSEDGSVIDQAGGYALLIRVLHHHLKEKSQATFRSGNDPEQLWLWVGATAVFSFLASIILHYFGLRLINPYMQALLFSVLTGMIVIFMSVRKLPRNYSPGSIPLQFLP
jgi:hypothetical protein